MRQENQLGQVYNSMQHRKALNVRYHVKYSRFVCLLSHFQKEIPRHKQKTIFFWFTNTSREVVE